MTIPTTTTAKPTTLGETGTTKTTTTTHSTNESFVPGFGISASIVALLAGTALLVRRR